MSTQTQLTAAASGNFAESLTIAQKEALQCAVAKIVAFGAQVGVSAEEMIQMLQSGSRSANCCSIWPAEAAKSPTKAGFATLQP